MVTMKIGGTVWEKMFNRNKKMKMKAKAIVKKQTKEAKNIKIVTELNKKWDNVNEGAEIEEEGKQFMKLSWIEWERWLRWILRPMKCKAYSGGALSFLKFGGPIIMTVKIESFCRK